MSDEKEEFRVETFTLFTSPGKRTEELTRLMLRAAELPKDKLFHIVLKPGQENRRDVANRLYQLSIGQAAKHGVEDGDVSVIAGKSKFHLLLPNKPIWGAELMDDKLAEEGEFERELCDAIAQSEMFDVERFVDEDGIAAAEQRREAAMYRAYDRAIRSKTLKTTPFARYLNIFFHVWARKGVVFEVNPHEQARVFNEGI